MQKIINGNMIKPPGVYLIILNEKRIVVINRTNNPVRKIKSAAFSIVWLYFDCFRIDKKDKRQLAIKRIMATKVISSMIVFSDFPNTLSEVKTRKQIPNRLEDVFKM